MTVSPCQRSLFFFVVLLLCSAFIMSTLHTSLTPNNYFASGKSLWNFQSDRVANSTSELILVPDAQYRRELLMERFELHDEETGLEAPHPSKPYFVMEDERSGKILMSMRDDDPEHPLNRIADVRIPKAKGDQETIFFFHIPKAHGSIVKSILTNCYGLRRAEKVEEPESFSFVGGVLNVDTQTRKGLAQARSANIIDSGLLDVVVTSYFFEGLLLFKPSHKGRVFTLLRHPVHQAEHLFYALQLTRPELEGVAFEDYVQSKGYHDNWLVRSLTNAKTGEVTEEHLLVAKGILARKVIIGIAEYLEESLKRLRRYFGWKGREDIGCLEFFLDEYHKVVQDEEETALRRGGGDWKLVAQRNHLDMELYYYALELFTKQGSTMFKRPYVDKEGVPIDFKKVKEERLEQERLQREEGMKIFQEEMMAQLAALSEGQDSGKEVVTKEVKQEGNET